MQLISRACWWMSAADSKRCFQQRRYVSLQIWGRALWVKQRIWKASLSPFFCPIFRSMKDEVRLNLSHIRGRIFAKEPSNSSAVSLKQFLKKKIFIISCCLNLCQVRELHKHPSTDSELYSGHFPIPVVDLPGHLSPPTTVWLICWSNLNLGSFHLYAWTFL